MAEKHHMSGRTGDQHPAWKTELDKDGAERRMARQRGRASDQTCAKCDKRALHWILGVTEGPAIRPLEVTASYEPRWSLDASYYIPVCRKHRNEFDPNLQSFRDLGIIRV